MKMRHVLFAQEPKAKKNKKYAEDESDLDDDWIVEHEDNLKEKEIEKAEKKFAKENEKLEAEGSKPQKDSVLKERLKAIEEEFERLADERGTKKATLKKDRPTEKVEEAIEKLGEKIKAFKLQMIDRDEGKEVALSTRYGTTRPCEQRMLTAFIVRSTTSIPALRLRGAILMKCRSRSSSLRPYSRNVRAVFVLGFLFTNLTTT